MEPASRELRHDADIGCGEGGKGHQRDSQQRQSTTLLEGQEKRMMLELD